MVDQAEIPTLERQRQEELGWLKAGFKAEADLSSMSSSLKKLKQKAGMVCCTSPWGKVYKLSALCCLSIMWTQ